MSKQTIQVWKTSWIYLWISFFLPFPLLQIQFYDINYKLTYKITMWLKLNDVYFSTLMLMTVIIRKLYTQKLIEIITNITNNCQRVYFVVSSFISQLKCDAFRSENNSETSKMNITKFLKPYWSKSILWLSKFC